MCTLSMSELSCILNGHLICANVCLTVLSLYLMNGIVWYVWISKRAHQCKRSVYVGDCSEYYVFVRSICVLRNEGSGLFITMKCACLQPSYS